MRNISGSTLYLRKHPVLVIMFLVGVVVWAFAVHRAAAASFTHDEAYSYDHYMGLSYTDIVLHKEVFTNNHLLNTFGMKLSQQLFGSSELALRLPNLLALILFLFYSARLLVHLPPWLAAGGYIVLATNSYMLEFFTLARGYGLSFGFMMMALYHLIRAAQGLQKRDVVLFNTAAVLATLSNFTLINVQIAGLITLYAVLLARVSLGTLPIKRLWAVSRTNLVMLAFSVAVLWNPVRNTLRSNALDFGGKGEFFESTATAWLRSFLPGVFISNAVQLGFDILIVVVVLAALVVFVDHYLRQDGAFFVRHAGLLVTALVLVLTCIAVELQHALFGMDRMHERFALFLVPLLVLTTVQLVALPNWRAWVLFTRGSIGVAALWGAFAFACTFGPYKSVEWQYDVRTKDAAIAIARDMRSRHYHGPPLHVGIHWMLEPTMNFYRNRLGLDRLQPFDRDSLTTKDAYRLVFQDAAGASIKAGYVQIKAYPESGTVLLKRRKAVP